MRAQLEEVDVLGWNSLYDVTNLLSYWDMATGVSGGGGCPLTSGSSCSYYWVWRLMFCTYVISPCVIFSPISSMPSYLRRVNSGVIGGGVSSDLLLLMDIYNIVSF